MRDYQFPGRSPVYATHGMAATSMPAATLTALDVLRAGGNALDAAVAAVAVLCVIEPQSTGIGGDCFCLYAPAGTGKVHALNGSGRAPAAANIDWYESRQMRALDNTSAHSVTVPGAISAWETLLKAHGRKGLDEVLQPAIRFAEDGWPVHPKVSWDWKRGEEKLRKGKSLHFLPGGQAPNTGDVFRQPALAETLRMIAKHGAKAFYEGPVAADMVATLREFGGLHTEEDFARGLQHGAEFVDPIQLGWKGYDIYPVPAERPGPAGADDHGHAGRPAHRPRRPRRRHSRPPAYRGGPAGVSRPGCVPGRSGRGRRAGEEAAQPRVSVAPCAALIDDTARDDRRCRCRASRCCRRTRTRSTCASSTRTATPAASSTACSRISAPASWRTTRA